MDGFSQASPPGGIVGGLPLNGTPVTDRGRTVGDAGSYKKPSKKVPPISQWGRGPTGMINSAKNCPLTVPIHKKCIESS